MSSPVVAVLGALLLSLPACSGPDAAGPAAPDAACAVEGERRCAADALTLLRCEQGRWAETRCMADEGRLCEAGACVDPWRYGSPAFSTCPGEPRATVEGLAAKAAYYDAIAVRLHVHPTMRWALDLYLKGGADGATASWQDVEQWRGGENDGLWSALYLASQAYRHGATGSPEALRNVQLLLEGEEQRMAITGVPGLFTRQLIPPGVPGIGCPGEPERYQPNPDKRGNRWVRIERDGCAWINDPANGAWTATPRCGLGAFAGWCFLDNVSQDEYVGHVLALGAVVRLVQDPQARSAARGLLEKIGLHLLQNELRFIDWDGRPTQWGKLYPGAPGDTPGYLAVMALSFVKTAAEATGRADLRAFYDGCLLQKDGPRACLRWLPQPRPLTAYFPETHIFEGPEGCLSNWNNISMLIANFYGLLSFERDPRLRGELQQALAREVMLTDHPRAALRQRNAWFDFMWAATKPLGPGSDGPALQAVEDGVCQLRQFPAAKHTPRRDPAARAPHACEDRFALSLAREPFGPADRCPSTFLWWGNPYARGGCQEDRREVRQPADYLLAYWMGRYYSFIPAGL